MPDKPDFTVATLVQMLAETGVEEDIIAKIKPDDDLTALSVDSFAVMRLTTTLQDDHGITIEAPAVFQLGTPAKIVEKLNELKRECGGAVAGGGMVAVPEPEAAPASTGAAPAATGADASSGGDAPSGGTEPIMWNGVAMPQAFPPSETMHELFARLSLPSEYADAFVEDGFDDVDILRIIEQEDFDELCRDTAKMKKGHMKKMQMWKEGNFGKKN